MPSEDDDAHHVEKEEREREREKEITAALRDMRRRRNWKADDKRESSETLSLTFIILRALFSFAVAAEFVCYMGGFIAELSSRLYCMELLAQIFRQCAR